MSADEAPLSVELIADLHAGVLSDDDAAVVRERVAADPEAAAALAALERAQSDVAALGEAPADEPPQETTDAVIAALRAESAHEVTGGGAGPSHAARPPRGPLSRLRVIAGLTAVVVAIAVGTVALVRLPPSPAASTPPDAKHITVAPPAPVMPLSDAEIAALLTSAPDYGPLTDQQRRASCLDGLGYGAGARVLGATTVQINGAEAVLLVLPSDVPDRLVALVVPPTCSTVNTGLIVDHVMDAP